MKQEKFSKSLVFDTGPLISLVTNNLLWILEPLKKQFKGEFYITPAVKKELIDKAFLTKRFELEAFQTSQYIRKGILKIIDNKEIRKITMKLMNLGNRSFKSRGEHIKIIHDAEVESLAADAAIGANAVVVDERTIRLLLENSPKLTQLMEKRLNAKVIPDKKNIKDFKKILKDVQIIRSTELVAVAYKMGLLDRYLIERSKLIKNPKKRLLDAALWAVKIRGCSISGKEIKKIVELET
jgi:hypothetical protein